MPMTIEQATSEGVEPRMEGMRAEGWLSPARGIALGVGLGLVAWVLIGTVAWLLAG